MPRTRGKKPAFDCAEALFGGVRWVFASALRIIELNIQSAGVLGCIGAPPYQEHWEFSSIAKRVS
jgi:hypothetical protein